MSNTGKNKSEYRPPIVTFMGHVDHGKTSILDAIRQTNVQKGEHGGITQHIGACQITHNDKKITFIDTPGHAAFTQMRARGGKAADIVVLVVAANAGVQPQTQEAIGHIKDSGVKVIVAINKMDLSGADPQKVKQQLAQENILVEDWGGDVISVEVSATKNTNLDKLLEAILLMAEMLELKSLPEAELEALIIESKRDRKRGVVVSAVLRTGTLNVGDKVMASGHVAKIRSLTNDKGKILKYVGPGEPVEILGFKETPSVGDVIVVEGSELAELSVDEGREEIIGQDTKRVVSIVLRADTQGTLEAVKASLADLVSSAVGVTYSIKFLLSAPGDITDSDVELASSGDGIVVGFNVRLAPQIKDMAQDLGVIVKSYKTIYDLIDDVKELLEGTAVSDEQKIKGRAEIIKTFKLLSKDIILGSKVLAGSLKPNMRIAIYDMDPADIDEDYEPLYRGVIKKLKIGKDDVEVVGKNNECGVLLKPIFEEAKKGHFIEAI
ncbi:translation initiation factor IF-2 [Patescibacteria group bacterium]